MLRHALGSEGAPFQRVLDVESRHLGRYALGRRQAVSLQGRWIIGMEPLTQCKADPECNGAVNLPVDR